MKTINCVDILLPKVCEPEKWAVVSCDQFTSQRDYWKELNDCIGDAPSTLKLIFPEVYLSDKDADERIKKINEVMEEYINGDVFETLKDSFILVKRDTSYGLSRLGLIVAVDLEDYGYVHPTNVPLRSTEGVVLNRIPPRLKIRTDALLESPHILVVMDDRQKRVIEPMYKNRDNLEKLYDFDLNMNGGHLTGYRVNKADVMNKLAVYENDMKKYYGQNNEFLFAVGDGNHSLATAQAHWDNVKKSLSEEEKKTHPARFALCELENLHDEGIVFEPIHRFVFGVDEGEFVAYLSDCLKGEGKLTLFSNSMQYVISCNTNNAECIAEIQAAIDGYIQKYGGSVDYIHGYENLKKIAEQNDGIAIIMPKIEKDKLFGYVLAHGNLCRKAFSMGEAEEKRYYYECHRIK